MAQCCSRAVGRAGCPEVPLHPDAQWKPEERGWWESWGCSGSCPSCGSGGWSPACIASVHPVLPGWPGSCRHSCSEGETCPSLRLEGTGKVFVSILCERKTRLDSKPLPTLRHFLESYYTYVWLLWLRQQPFWPLMNASLRKMSASISKKMTVTDLHITSGFDWIVSNYSALALNVTFHSLTEF